MYMDREVVVCSDGFEVEAHNVVVELNKMAKQHKVPCFIKYGHTREHKGRGDYPRAAALKQATKDWVIFVDAGTAISTNLLHALNTALKQAPEASIITWDMFQLTVPSPHTTSVSLVTEADRSQGLPYVLPGCSTAVKRQVAQEVGWPIDVKGPSDWAFFSMVWEKLFGKGDAEDVEKINNEVVLIPWVLTCAYGNRSGWKVRKSLNEDEYVGHGFDKGYNGEWNGDFSRARTPEPIQNP